MKEFISTRKQYLKAIARETARMSYPGRMSGVVEKGTKKAVEEFFVQNFPIGEVWEGAEQIAGEFDKWHANRVKQLGRHIEHHNLVKKKQDRAEAIAAKLFNTYCHQLMKYQPCRPLWNHLHLPLDRRILVALGRLKRRTHSMALNHVSEILKKAPYSLAYREYLQVQHALADLILELNARPHTEVQLKSRIELNLLWAE